MLLSTQRRNTNNIVAKEIISVIIYYIKLKEAGEVWWVLLPPTHTKRASCIRNDKYIIPIKLPKVKGNGSND